MLLPRPKLSVLCLERSALYRRWAGKVSSLVAQTLSKSVPNYSTQPTFAESSSYPALIACFAKSLGQYELVLTLPVKVPNIRP